jgi:putative transposase
VARPTRIDLPGAWYHVLNRGIERRMIYRSERCRARFMQLLAQLPERFGVRLHGYVLMGNHYHLQVETPEANLSQAIHWLNASYGIWFNRKFNRVGPLFQGRFKAVLHEQTEALTINRYIHLNPVRVSQLGGHEGRSQVRVETSLELNQARVQALEEYPWSSYGFYAGLKPVPKWFETHAILDYFGPGSQSRQQRAFRQQLQRAAALGEWESDWKQQIKYTVLLGSEEFVDRARRLLRGDPQQQTGLRQAARVKLNWEAIEGAVAVVWGQSWETLSRARGVGARETVWFLARTQGRLTLKELGQRAGGLHHNAVSIGLRRFQERLQKDRRLKRRLNQVQKVLSASTPAQPGCV